MHPNLSRKAQILEGVVRAASPAAVVEIGCVDDLPARLIVGELALPVHSCQPDRDAGSVLRRWGPDARIMVSCGDGIEFLKSVEPEGGIGRALVCLGSRTMAPLTFRKHLRAVLARGHDAVIVVDGIAVPHVQPPLGDLGVQMLYGLLPPGHVIYFPDVVQEPAGGSVMFAVLAPPGRLDAVPGLRGGDYQSWLQADVEGNRGTDRSSSRAVQRLCSEISSAADAFRMVQGRLTAELSAKERVIQELSRALGTEQAARAELAGLHRELESKEAVIRDLSAALEAFRARGAYIRAWPARQARSMWRVLRSRIGLNPRLGVLRQHAPRQVVLRRPSSQRSESDVPPVTLVTPSYMQGAFIERTIRSVLGQGYPRLQYVVQDGGSTDQTREIIETYSGRLARWSSERDNGQSQAINRGFEGTSGEIMGWLNSDDMLLPGALHRIARVFRDNPGVDVVYGNRVIIDEQDMQIGRWVLPGHDGDMLSWADFVPQESLFWRRSAWDRAGGRIDESFRFAMDWDLLIRFRAAGARFMHVPAMIGAFRVHAEQKTAATMADIGEQEMLRIRQRIHGRAPSQDEIGMHVSRFIKRHVRADVAYAVSQRINRAMLRTVVWPPAGGRFDG